MKLLWLFALPLVIACNNSSEPPTKKNPEESWTLLPFTKADDVNPILTADSTTQFFCPVRKAYVQWEEKDVFNPAAVVRNDTVFLLYRAEDSVGKYAGTSRIGIAWSTDGLHFTKHPAPVLYPDNDEQKQWEWEGGCEDPRIVEDSSGTYYLTYTAYDGDKARLMLATSTDLYHWKKRGLVLDKGLWSKSGAIVCTYKNQKAVAVKINGKYWMYWGDTDIFLASSEDLIHWTSGNKVFGPRNKKFDSDLVEPGPPAMLTDSGIVLIYNSRNVHLKGDTSLPEGTYAASQILMDKNDPMKVINRMDTYFMKPDKPYEISGQVNHVCFVEGLVYYKGKWFLYYGTADSKIAVAVK